MFIDIFRDRGMEEEREVGRETRLTSCLPEVTDRGWNTQPRCVP